MSDPMQVDEEKIADLRDPAVTTKYKTACEIVNYALGQVVKSVAAGQNVFEICEAGDGFLNEKLKGCYNKGKILKGVAFPTSISVNNIAGHFSPLKEESTVLRAGDLVKIDMACHIDGYVAAAAHTVILAGDSVPQKAVDVLAAAYYGSLAAAEATRAGRTNSDVAKVIQEVATFYGVQVAEGVLSHQMKQYIIDGNKTILARPSIDQKVDEVTFENNEVYSIDVVYTTGDGKLKQTESRTTIYKRAVENNYDLKLKASRALFSEINAEYPTFPFAVRYFPDAKSRLGMKEIVEHQLVHAYPVLTEKPGEFVAQFKTTVLLLPSGTSRVTGLSVDFSTFPTKPSKDILASPPSDELKDLLAAAFADKKSKKKAKADQ
nr:ErbB-3 binding protein 1 [Andalucia godoyi]|eukprot:ANDGO_04264.mRNA.1 ERBB-3 BINDING PROTEIN 1